MCLHNLHIVFLCFSLGAIRDFKLKHWPKKVDKGDDDFCNLHMIIKIAVYEALTLCERSHLR